MAAVQSCNQLLVLRLFLGVMESGLSPGTAFLISCWYRPEEQAKRVAMTLSAALLGGAFGGVIAGSVAAGLEGVKGVRGWRWLFLVEGGVTVLWGITAIWLMVDFPGSLSTAKRFGERERKIAVERIRRAGVLVDEDYSRSRGIRGYGYGGRVKLGKVESMVLALKDWRVVLITIGVGVRIPHSFLCSFFIFLAPFLMDVRQQGGFAIE